MVRDRRLSDAVSVGGGSGVVGDVSSMRVGCVEPEDEGGSSSREERFESDCTAPTAGFGGTPRRDFR